MSMMSGAVSSGLFFLDFEAHFRELVTFEPWVLLFRPVGGITKMSTSQLSMR